LGLAAEADVRRSTPFGEAQGGPIDEDERKPLDGAQDGQAERPRSGTAPRKEIGNS